MQYFIHVTLIFLYQNESKNLNVPIQIIQIKITLEKPSLFAVIVDVVNAVVVSYITSTYP